jgi:hypothetical protein
VMKPQTATSRNRIIGSEVSPRPILRGCMSRFWRRERKVRERSP